MKTVDGLLQHCKKALKDEVKYIYGAKMQVMSYKQIKQLQTIYGKAYVWDSDLKKAGCICCDCSGLISSYTGIMRGSSAYEAKAAEEVSIAELKINWNKYIGWGLWLKGHIGVVSDTYGCYYAMDGSARNMVHYPLSKQNWTKAVKLCDINYIQEDEEMMESKAMYIDGREYPDIKQINKDGHIYVELASLKQAGYNVGYNPNNKLASIAKRAEETEMSVNGENKRVNRVLIYDENYIRLRDFESCGMNVGYDANTKRPTLKY